jgi:acetyltransferase
MSRHEATGAGRRHTGKWLEPIFNPGAVALIGASERAGSVGRALTENLRAFPGTTYLVNPKHQQIFDRPSFPNLRSLPGPVDLAVIATPARTAPDLIRDCVTAGVPGAIILSAGFHETGKAGAELEQSVIAEAHKGNLRIIGPNCLGVMVPHRRLNVTFANGLAQPGGVAFLSQSGALCTAVLDWSLRECVGFSGFVSVGAMADIGWGELITWFGDDPRTTSIVCYMESVGDARSFLSAAREVALKKPIIVLKVGRTDAAAQAAASHTGALTGSDAVLDAAFRRVGVLRVNTINELFQMSELLAKQPRVHGPRLAVVTNAGGAGALATDALLSSGGRLTQLSPDTIAALNKLLPPFWSHGNPIDVLGDADPVHYGKAFEVAALDPQTDGLLVILTPQSMTDATGTATQIRDLSTKIGKPILCSWMGGGTVDGGKSLLNTAGIATFDYPDDAAQAFALMWRYSDNLRALYETPSATPSGRLAKPSAVAKRIAKARHDDHLMLTEVESKQILAAYGIPTVPTFVAHKEQEAIRLAEKLGFPVAIKLLSDTITHKAEVGGVELNVRTPAGIRKAWRNIRTNVEKRRGLKHFGGVSVQPMIRSKGYEVIVGSSVDAQFGPVLLFGAGGGMVEVFKDRALALPPLNTTLARRLMEQTRIYKALSQSRGAKRVDLSALEQILVRFSQLVAEHPAILESDINPLLVSPDQIIALDARFVLHPASVADEQLPKLAIRPYPTQYVTSFKLRNSAPVTIRPIRPDDEPLMIQFHATLSDQTVYQRYFAPLKYDQRIAHQRLSRVCFIDYDREMVLVVERIAKSGKRDILGVGRLSKLHESRTGEFALLIPDQWHGHGLGTELLRQIVQIARDEKLECVVATILPGNRAMQHVAQSTGFTLSRTADSSELHAELVLKA